MAWPTITIKDWASFEAFADQRASIGSPLQTTYLYRGQSDSSWPLHSSLLRIMKGQVGGRYALDLEGRMQELFRSQAYIHFTMESLPDDSNLLSWWQIMQHHGAPTRLIDWSASPYVAAYFAVVHNWDKDSAVWMIHPFSLNEAGEKALAGTKFEQALTNELAPPVVIAIEMTRHSNRTIAQQGHFTASANILGDQQTIIESLCSASKNSEYTFRKIIIPKELKPQFLFRLHKMNVHSGALFPGQDGIGRSIYELAMLTTVYKDEA